MPRGRTPARHDDAARIARDEIQRFLQTRGMTPSALAHAARVSPSSALRVLAAEPPKWTPAFSKLARFVENQAPAVGGLPEALVASLEPTAAHSMATVLRSLADLIEGLARPRAQDTRAAPAARRSRSARTR